jgi:hypothetical protein
MAKNRIGHDSSEHAALADLPIGETTASPPQVNGDAVAPAEAPVKRARKAKQPDPWLLAMYTNPASGEESVAAFARTMPEYIEQMIEHRAANGNYKEAYMLFHCQPAF